MTTLQDPRSKPFTPPYAPSWFDHFKNWIESLPGPWWFYYLLLALVLLGVHFFLDWQSGISFSNETQPYFVVIATGSAYFLILVHFLDRAARRALYTFRPALPGGDAEYQDWVYRLTVLPSTPTLFWSFVGSLWVVVALVGGFVPFQLLRANASPVWHVFNAGIELMLWFIIGMFGYHTVRQLNLVKTIYDEHARIHLFRLGPLYALSGLTARTAIGVAIIGYGTVLTGTRFSNSATGIPIALASSLIVLICFLVPLLGIHRRLVEEKDRTLSEIMTRLETLLHLVQRDVDGGTLDRASALKDQTTSLEIQQRLVERIPTWPWQPETFRVIVTALLLPIVLTVIQFIIQKMLQP